MKLKINILKREAFIVDVESTNKNIENIFIID